jgi:hypothetical protein
MGDGTATGPPPHKIDVAYYLAPFVGTALGTLFRFWSYRKWVWLAQPAGPGMGADGRPETLEPAQPHQDGTGAALTAW